MKQFQAHQIVFIKSAQFFLCINSISKLLLYKESMGMSVGICLEPWHTLLEDLVPVWLLCFPFSLLQMDTLGGSR